MWEIRPERPEDEAEIEAVVTQGFGPGRFAKTAYRLREGVVCEAGLSFVAVEDGALCGSIRFWPIVIGAHPALLLGPLAVQSGERGRGIGIGLMKHGIELARNAGHRAIILVGDLAYYSKVGFARLAPGKAIFPGAVDPERILGLSLNGAPLENLAGDVCRARIDYPVCADSAPLAVSVD